MKYPSFLPHLREIDEDYEVSSYVQDHDSQIIIEKSEKNIHNISVAPELSGGNSNALEYEIRDEANRSWFKAIFDEYEYKPKKLKDQSYWKWFSKEDTPEEKILITKLDFLICVYSFAMYFVKYLDQSNLNNAYVSNMKEDLGMKGNDLIVTQIVYIVSAFLKIDLISL